MLGWSGKAQNRPADENGECLGSVVERFKRGSNSRDILWCGEGTDNIKMLLEQGNFYRPWYGRRKEAGGGSPVGRLGSVGESGTREPVGPLSRRQGCQRALVSTSGPGVGQCFSFSLSSPYATAVVEDQENLLALTVQG